MLFSENLTNLMQESDISNVALAKELGVSHESIRQWKSGRMFPTIDKANKLAEYFNISLDELLGKRIDTERNIPLPLVGVVSAGPFDILNEDEWDERLSVSADLLAGRPKNNCVTMRVSGDSMSPYLLEGDVLIVHRQPYAVNGNIVVVYDPSLNGYTVKRYKQNGDTVILEPYNSAYAPIKYTNPKEQELDLYGVCVGLKRKLV